MKALVTGGAGFIGSHVARQLVHRGDEVRVLHLASDDLRNLDDLDLERVVGDVTDPESVAAAMDGVDVVFHLAAIYALWMARPESREPVEFSLRNTTETSPPTIFSSDDP